MVRPPSCCVKVFINVSLASSPLTRRYLLFPSTAVCTRSDTFCHAALAPLPRSGDVLSHAFLRKPDMVYTAFSISRGRDFEQQMLRGP